MILLDFQDGLEMGVGFLAPGGVGVDDIPGDLIWINLLDFLEKVDE